MAFHVCMGAMLNCSFGSAPSALQVLPIGRVMVQGVPAANVMDNKPIVNILPFGTCSSMANPVVAAATAAALGALTPMPCLPVTAVGPWLPGSPTILQGGLPALQDSSKLMCAWAGVIQIAMAGQMTEMIP